MAIDNTVGMWNENAGSVYNAREYRRLLERLMGYDVVTSPGTGAGGVFRPADLTPTQAGSPNMTVLVAAGAAFVDGSESGTQGGYFVYNDASVTVTVPAANATNPRIDIIGVQVKDSEYSGALNDAAIVLVAGTPAASPVEPTLPANFMTICRVDVAANATQILTANITDRRRRMSALGGVAVCTSTTRPSVNLWEGLLIYETDTDSLKQYTTATTLWTPPWNLAWGHMATPVSVATNSGTVAAGSPIDAQCSITTSTLVANRRMRFRWETHIVSSGVGGDGVKLTITDASNTIKATQDCEAIRQNNAVQAYCTSLEVSTAAAFTRKGRVQRNNTGNGNVGTFADAARPQTMTAEDLGPSGAPS